MIYEYIRDISLTDRFIYVTVIIGTILVLSRVNITVHVIVGLIVGILIVYYYNEKNVYTGHVFLKSMKDILNSNLMKPDKNKHLAKNSELVLFLDGHKEYYRYNPKLWNDLVRYINNFLHIMNDIEIGVERFNMDYDTMKGLKRKIMNTFHSFVHRIPHTPHSNDKFHIGMERLENLLNQDIDVTHTLVTHMNSQSINNATTFHYKNHPCPDDKGINLHYHYFER